MKYKLGLVMLFSVSFLSFAEGSKQGVPEVNYADLGWLVDVKADRMTDKKNATAMLPSAEMNETVLALQCNEGEKNIRVGLISVIDTFKGKTFTHRIDTDKSVSSTWEVNNMTAGGLAGSPDKLGLWKKLSEGKELLVEYKNYRNGSQIVTFNLEHYNTVLTKLKAECAITQ